MIRDLGRECARTDYGTPQERFDRAYKPLVTDAEKQRAWRDSVHDAVLDLMLAGEMFAEARAEIMHTAQLWEAARHARQRAYWARHDAELAS